MKFKTITFQNFGPIEEGVISKNKIMIFFGPNNSGKSLVSRFIHSLTFHDIPKPSKMELFGHLPKVSMKELYNVFGLYMLEYSGIRYDNVVTFKKNKCVIETKTN